MYVRVFLVIVKFWGVGLSKRCIYISECMSFLPFCFIKIRFFCNKTKKINKNYKLSLVPHAKVLKKKKIFGELKKFGNMFQCFQLHVVFRIFCVPLAVNEDNMGLSKWKKLTQSLLVHYIMFKKRSLRISTVTTGTIKSFIMLITPSETICNLYLRQVGKSKIR